jgi:N-ethylmaleimide reductase
LHHQRKTTEAPRASTTSNAVANGDASLIAPKRIELGLPLNPYDRSTFLRLRCGGYTDYPKYEVHESGEACPV